jgi:hypothetical protein
MANTHTEQALNGAATPSASKGIQIGIWVSTGFFALMFAASGVLFVSGQPEVAANFRHLGYPDYFRQLLGLAKLLGVAALVLPVPFAVLREWAYAGFAFTCLAAASSHALSGDPFGKSVPSLFALALLMTSYFLRRRVARGAHAMARA